VSELSIDLGDAVESGDLLLRLNPDELELLAAAARAALAQTKAVIEQTRAAYRRARQLHEQSIASEVELENALSQLRVAEANHNAAAKQLAIAEDHVEDTSLRAPLSGFVAVRNVSVGQFVQPYTAVLELVVVDPLRLRLDIPERHVGAIREGMPVIVTLEAFPGEEFAGQIARIGAALDPNTRTLLVEAAIPNADRRLKPGQFAHTTLDLGMEDAIVVPRAAVDTFAGTHRAFVIDPTGHLEARSVTPGRDLGETVVILEGIDAEELVAISHLDQLTDGLQVGWSQ
jgi:RND family efflux transporter MFP subunit